jgi:hypothetical protein
MDSCPLLAELLWKIAVMLKAEGDRPVAFGFSYKAFLPGLVLKRDNKVA